MPWAPVGSLGDEGERERERWIDRQREGGRDRDRQTDRERETKTEGERDRGNNTIESIFLKISIYKEIAKKKTKQLALTNMGRNS